MAEMGWGLAQEGKIEARALFPSIHGREGLRHFPPCVRTLPMCHIRVVFFVGTLCARARHYWDAHLEIRRDVLGWETFPPSLSTLHTGREQTDDALLLLFPRSPNHGCITRTLSHARNRGGWVKKESCLYLSAFSLEKGGERESTWRLPWQCTQVRS